MPELPEVETVKRILAPELTGRKIAAVTILSPAVIACPASGRFADLLAGQSMETVSRRGKFLIISLGNASRLVIHLRMTGSLMLLPASAPMEKHTHVSLALSNGNELRFIDTRRFGRMWLLDKDEEDRFTGISRLGPEPEDITKEHLMKEAGSSGRPVKSILLDQSIVAGIGNIYSDEILFRAGIHPARKASSLSDSEWEKLASLIPDTLAFYTEKNAIQLDDYIRTKGQEYRNTPYLQIYGHCGEPCPVCGGMLRKISIGGRSSVFCPACQKEG